MVWGMTCLSRFVTCFSLCRVVCRWVTCLKLSRRLQVGDMLQAAICRLMTCFSCSWRRPCYWAGSWLMKGVFGMVTGQIWAAVWGVKMAAVAWRHAWWRAEQQVFVWLEGAGWGADVRPCREDNLYGKNLGLLALSSGLQSRPLCVESKAWRKRGWGPAVGLAGHWLV